VALKVFEYGFAEGLRTQSMAEEDNVITIRFPKARILYWETSGKAPNEATLRLIFPDETRYDYKVKTFKFLDHDISELEKQKMAILLPFYVLKLRQRVVSAKTSAQRSVLSAEMKTIFDELVTAIDRSAEAGLMNESDKRIVLEHMERMYRELYSQYKEFTEVDTMLKDRLLTYSEEAELKGRKEGIKEGIKEGVEKVARSLLSRGVPPDIIAESAELPLDAVKALMN
jgi:predicted transposase/invertase (TIGR01784 family)